MERKSFSVIILAAGAGTRMKSPLPKVLHPIAGQPMILRIIRAAQGAGASEVRVVIGVGASLVEELVRPLGVLTMVQENPLGTGDAVKAAEVENLEGPVLILNGDHPLISAKDIKSILEEHNNSSCQMSVVTSVLSDPGHYGRIVRQGGNVYSIVEAKDASAETLKIAEVNTGIYVIEGSLLKEALPKIENNNNQKEYYLTDLVELVSGGSASVQGISCEPHVAEGVNSQREVASATSKIFMRKANELMDQGVTFIDPQRTYIEDTVSVGAGTVIYPGVFLKGDTKIGNLCVIEPNCFINQSTLGDGVQVRMGSYFESVQIDSRATIGPYARLRPGTEIGEEAHVGNFVEMKKVKFGKNAKAGHLTYLGDAEVGESTNIGCGTITCNFAADGKKYFTSIGKNVFVGSDTQFVAPVKIGDGSFIGSGSTITKNVPEKALALTRAKLLIKENYKIKAKK